MAEEPKTSVYELLVHAWEVLGLPQDDLTPDIIDLSSSTLCYQTSFRVGDLAQFTIALSALTAAHFRSIRQNSTIPKVKVPADHACLEFKSERLYALDGKPPSSPWGAIGGLHKTSDGYVRMHDSFPNHRDNALSILGLSSLASRADVSQEMLKWKSVHLETEAFLSGAVIVALRSPEEWNKLPQAKALPTFPVKIRRILDSPPYTPKVPQSMDDNKCLRGIRVVEMSRVIAAPVSGRTLAAHGADVIWVTSPTLPDLPALDIDLSRGKRTVQLDIKQSGDKRTLMELIRTADVFIQSYRPGSLAAQGLSEKELSALNPHLIIANLNAYGVGGPWAGNRGFDSLVQTCSGINVADARAYGAGEPAHVLPCQALDHGAGYFLASGILVALSRRTKEGGSYSIHVSLAGVMNFLKNMGQYPGKSGFSRTNLDDPEDWEPYLETRQTRFGELKAIRHSASISGVEVGWEEMPKPLGSDDPIWL